MTGVYNNFFNPDGSPKQLFGRQPQQPPGPMPDLWQMMLNTTSKIPMTRTPSYDPPSVMENAPDLLELLPSGTPKGMEDWLDNSGSGQLTKRVIDSWMGMKPLLGMANEHLWDPYQRFVTGRPSVTPRGPVQGPPAPADVPPEVSGPSAPSRGGSSMLDLWKQLSGGGSENPILLPETKRREYPSGSVPKMEGPSKPDYSEADKYAELSRPKDREKTDTSMAMIMGLLSGFDPRAGESFGMTLGRMAGPGLKAKLSADEKNKDIDADNSNAGARWNALRGQTLSGRADAAANLATEASRTNYTNAMAEWNNLLNKTKFDVDQDEKIFDRGVKRTELGFSGRRADATERSANANIMRALSAFGEQSSRSPMYDLQDYVAKMASGKLAYPPGLDSKQIDGAAMQAFAAEQAQAKSNPALQAQYMNPQFAMQRMNLLRQDALSKLIAGMDPEMRESILKDARNARKKDSSSSYAGAFE